MKTSARNHYGACAALCVGLALAASALAQVTTTLIITGNVARSEPFTIDDLRRFPAHKVEYRPRESGSGTDGGAVRRYTGCLLRDVLAAAKPVESKPRELRRSYVVATASDGYEVVFSWAELFVSPVGDNVFVVYERDGAELGGEEGPIALIVTTDTRPVRHVKWLQALRLRAA